MNKESATTQGIGLRVLAWVIALALFISILTIEVTQGSEYSWINKYVVLPALLLWIISGFGCLVELFRRCYQNAAVLGAAFLCVTFWLGLHFSGWGETVIARHTMADGTELVWSQSFKGGTEPYEIYLYYQRVGEPWRIIQYCFEDTRWLRGAIESDGNKAVVSRWLPVASFSSETEQLSRHDYGVTYSGTELEPDRRPAFLTHE